MRPLEAVPVVGGSSEVVEVGGVREMFVCGVPERCGRAEALTAGAAVLFEVVGEPERRPCLPPVLGCGGQVRVAGRAPLGPGCSATQRGLFAVDRSGEVGVRRLRPVIFEFVEVTVAEVVAGGVGEEHLRQMKAHAEAACVDCGIEQCPGSRSGLLVAAQQRRGSRQVLCHPPVSARPGEAVRQQRIALLGEGGRRAQCFRVEGVRDGEGAAGEQFPHSAVGIRLTRGRHGCVPVGVLRPESPQDEYRLAVGVGQQAVHGGCDPLARSGVAEVVLGLVEPHHSVGLHTLDVAECGVGPRRVEWMPQLPTPL
ncbi:hypothetical protein ACU4GG_30215 [Streptomyces nojiriensis]